MVSVVHSVAAQSDIEQSLQTLGEGLSGAEQARLREAADVAATLYARSELGSGESVWPHALGMALIVAGLKLDVDARLAALLFAVPAHDEHGLEWIDSRFGPAAAHLVRGISRLNRLRPITRDFIADSLEGDQTSPQELKAQVEVLRKMLLAMVEDIRVVLLRLASRTQTLRFYARNANDLRVQVARETLEIYSPLANRLGVWELKWELEDLSFRFLHPDIYKKIASLLDEKRLEREQFITDAIARLKGELAQVGIHQAEIYGRPKHIYSIWNKMRRKGVEFSEVYDIRALRVIVDEVRDCYTVLGIVHNIWTPIPKEFDDYISNPKGNHYRSLHTAVRAPDGRSLEVQIRTWEMHKHAELGVAAHWRYKEGSKQAEDNYDEKIAWLRQLLTWKDEVADTSDWVRHYKRAALNETIYVMTPQGKVVDLPSGSTPVDFAYRVHTDLGHRCRGAKVDGVLLPLNTTLETGQRVEIVTAKQGGPSRDWLNPSQGYIQTKSARIKVRQWFAALALETTLNEGRAIVSRELQRLGFGGANQEALAQKLGFEKPNELYLAAARNELSLRQLQMVARGDQQADPLVVDVPAMRPRTPSVAEGNQGILIVGVDKLLTQLARCCKPAPPDPIEGFVTRGKGVSIHRVDCSNFLHLAALHPERVIETAWGVETQGVFASDILVDAYDRQGLLRDISDVLAREKVNVIAVNTQSKASRARMGFTVEVADLAQLQRMLALILSVEGVIAARRS